MNAKGVARFVWIALAVLVVAVASVAGYFLYNIMYNPPPEQILRIGIPRDVRAIDPGITKTNIEVSVERLVYEPLFVPEFKDGNMTLKPWLAESIRLLNETFWEVKIRQGIKFHCGHELTAYDIAWQLNRVAYWTNITAPRFCLGTLRYFVAVNNSVLLVGADSPVVAALSYLGETHNLPGVCSVCAVKEGFGQSVFCGTGPYKVVEKVSGEKVVLVKNKDYWNKEHAPKFDRIIVNIIPDSAARVNALEAGELDYITHPPPAEIDRLKNLGFEVDIYRHHRLIYYWMNTAKPPTDDVRVRMAINYAVDKKAICQTLYYNYTTPADGVFVTGPPGRLQFANETNEPMFPYDPDRARQLLSEAGYGPDNPCRITIWNSMDRYLLDRELGEVIAQYLRDVGIEVNLQQMQFASYQGTVMSNCRKVQNGEMNASDLPYHMGIYSLAIITMDLDWGLNINWWSKSAESLTFWWVPGRFGTAMPLEFDGLYLEQSRTVDPEERIAILEEMQRMIYEACPYLWMHSESTLAARVPNLKGVQSRAEYYYWYDAYFEKK